MSHPWLKLFLLLLWLRGSWNSNWWIDLCPNGLHCIINPYIIQWSFIRLVFFLQFFTLSFFIFYHLFILYVVWVFWVQVYLELCIVGFWVFYDERVSFVFIFDLFFIYLNLWLLCKHISLSSNHHQVPIFINCARVTCPCKGLSNRNLAFFRLRTNLLPLRLKLQLSIWAHRLWNRTWIEVIIDYISVALPTENVKLFSNQCTWMTVSPRRNFAFLNALVPLELVVTLNLLFLDLLINTTLEFVQVAWWSWFVIIQLILWSHLKYRRLLIYIGW
jgi:hypothetical protein